MQFACSEIATKQISSVLVWNVSRPFSAQYCFSWCKLHFGHLFRTPWQLVELHLSTEWSFVERQNSRLFSAMFDCCSSANTWIPSVGAIQITKTNV